MSGWEVAAYHVDDSIKLWNRFHWGFIDMEKSFVSRKNV